ncbi:MAG TPA: hypothetical protein PK263_01555 [bacterium]|nr:hypothetical protein [bacterium]
MIDNELNLDGTNRSKGGVIVFVVIAIIGFLLVAGNYYFSKKAAEEADSIFIDDSIAPDDFLNEDEIEADPGTIDSGLTE